MVDARLGFVGRHDPAVQLAGGEPVVLAASSQNVNAWVSRRRKAVASAG